MMIKINAMRVYLFDVFCSYILYSWLYSLYYAQYVRLSPLSHSETGDLSSLLSQHLILFLMSISPHALSHSSLHSSMSSSVLEGCSRLGYHRAIT